jgi:D-3-phosphoglycerate dehydrogenase
MDLAEKIGLLQAQLFPGRLKAVTIRVSGEAGRFGFAPLKIAVLKGLLAPVCGETVNYVNAPAMAHERGINVYETQSSQSGDFTNYIEVEALQNRQTHCVGGTLFGNQKPRIVKIDAATTDITPKGYVIVIRNEDQPGVVGRIGNILGRNRINIADMSLERHPVGRKVMALTVINTDQPISEKVRRELKKFPPIKEVEVVNLR